MGRPSTRSESSSDMKNGADHPAAAEEFELPKISLGQGMLDPDSTLAVSVYKPFSADLLAAGLLRGCSPQAIKTYVQAYTRETVTTGLGTLVQGHRMITYAIERNSAECLRTLIEYGADAKAKDFEGVPVLALAIMRTKWTVRNAVDVVKILLISGADHRHIPQDMWMEYVKTPTADTNHKPSEPSLVTRTKWCTPTRRAILAETLNLTMRYYLWRASRLDADTERTLQIAAAHRMSNLLSIPFQVIGQEPATTLVMQNVYAHISTRVRKPLVFAFAGLSGHGKTELATQIGAMLSVPTVECDCAQAGSLETLIGPTSPYHGYEKGSPLNNHLSEFTGQRSVVFLDEFDKTTKEVQEALLKVMDTGTYRDRRTNEDVDASQSIWILATNLGDKNIDRFHSKHIANRKDADIDKISIEPLRQQLFHLFINIFSPAIAGRINVIAPFFPFSPNEQAVVAHKFVLGLQDETRQPIDMEEPQSLYIGHCHISVVDDGRVCQHLAQTGYVKDLGARSISNRVGDLRRDHCVAYSKEEGRVTEDMNHKPLMKYSVQMHPVSETEHTVSVFRDGETALP